MSVVLRLAAVAAALVAIAPLSGCGLAGGESRPGGVQLRVTRGFGQRLLYAARHDRVDPQETVMGLLRSKRRVETTPGGGAVESIEGLGGGGRQGRGGWSYFVNGLEGSAAAGERRLDAGDVVHWDYRGSGGAKTLPAIVGAYPEPLVSGTGGKRLPVRIECADDRARSCREVERRLSSAGVTGSVGPFGEPGGEGVLRVIVAPWSLTRRVRAAAKLEEGPQASGVFARFRAGGQRLELLDPSGQSARTAPPGTGLVAATALEGEQRVWLVTGSDEAGVRRAAGALDRATLRDRYAVAALPDGVEALPIGGAGQARAAGARLRQPGEPAPFTAWPPPAGPVRVTNSSGSLREGRRRQLSARPRRPWTRAGKPSGAPAPPAAGRTRTSGSRPHRATALRAAGADAFGTGLLERLVSPDCGSKRRAR